MTESSIIGTRIRERRVQKGIRQSELAARVDISPSYLNLIEHNRRRIGGKILNRLAEVLEVEASLLAEGAEAALIASLNEAAAGKMTGQTTGQITGPTRQSARAEEFAGRFPDWAQLLVDLHRENATLEQSVRTLTDRLAHDPQLAASLHDVISTVTAIRSTASILVETKELEPEWQGRFHRNINEESKRLAEGAEDLVRYLEAAPDIGAEVKSPQDELHAFLAEKRYHFPALEVGAEGGMDGDVVGGALERELSATEAIQSDAARHLARDVLEQYQEDARVLPLAKMVESVRRLGSDPVALCQTLGADMSQLFRRLAMLPEAEVGPVGLAICDGSGALILRKPLPEFSMPPVNAACTLWPLYQAMAQPQQPVRAMVRQVGRDAQPALTYAVSQEVQPASFELPALRRAHMLVLPASIGMPALQHGQPRDVGVSCRICPLTSCAARREPSMISNGF